jgi:hypothetical protein
MNVLVGRERKILGELAAALMGKPLLACGPALERIRASLSQAPFAVRLFFRLGLFLFEWGTLFLRTGSGRFEHFSRLPWGPKLRYVRLWMNHRRPEVRQTFLFLKLLVLAALFDTC